MSSWLSKLLGTYSYPPAPPVASRAADTTSSTPVTDLPMITSTPTSSVDSSGNSMTPDNLQSNSPSSSYKLTNAVSNAKTNLANAITAYQKKKKGAMASGAPAAVGRYTGNYDDQRRYLA